MVPLGVEESGSRIARMSWMAQCAGADDAHRAETIVTNAMRVAVAHVGKLLASDHLAEDAFVMAVRGHQKLPIAEGHFNRLPVEGHTAALRGVGQPVSVAVHVSSDDVRRHACLAQHLDALDGAQIAAVYDRFGAAPG